jgi:hypothetical protein
MAVELHGDFVHDHISGLREGRTMEFEGMVLNLDAASNSPDFGLFLKRMALLGSFLMVPSKDSEDMSLIVKAVIGIAVVVTILSLIGNSSPSD